MPAKEIIFRSAARGQVLAGVEALTRAVAVTLGPRGRNVVIEKSFGAPTVTKDGVTVAKAIELEGRFANMGAQMVREVASKTSDVAGDGTTTATVLAHAIFRDGYRLVAAGYNPMELKRGMEQALEVVVEALQKRSRETREPRAITQIATISANGDASIGNLLGEAMERVGDEGVVTVEQAKGLTTTLEVVEGMQLDRGYLSPYFVTDSQRMEVVLDDAYVLLHDKKISSMKDMLPLLEAVARSGKPLLIVAEDVEGEALSTLVVNRLRGTLAVAAIKAPGFGDRRKELLEDLAVLTGAEVLSEELGVKLVNAGLETLGRADRILISKDDTTLVGGAGTGEAIAARCETIRRRIGDTKSDYDREKLEERLAKLTGGVAVISVGAASEVELREKKARVEDALHATRAAIAEGIVAGGGTALLRCQPALDALSLSPEQTAGVGVIRRALEAPLHQIASNAGREGSIVVERVRQASEGQGYDAALDRYTDMVEAGIIDPTKVVRSALQNAVSIAALMLTTDAMIAERPPRPATGA